MIRLRDIEDDFYEFDETNYCITGSRTKRKYQLGDTVKIQIVRTDLVRKQIDFRIVNGDGSKMTGDGKGGTMGARRSAKGDGGNRRVKQKNSSGKGSQYYGANKRGRK